MVASILILMINLQHIHWQNLCNRLKLRASLTVKVTWFKSNRVFWKFEKLKRTSNDKLSRV